MAKKKDNNMISLKSLIILVISIWLFSGIISWFFFKNWKESASFGDTFGAINSLFSGLALAVIIYTIYLQKTELSLQRKELEYTREELSRTADAQEQTAKLMNEQIRLSNLPFLQYNSKIIRGKECLIISNQSDNPIFDVDIWLFITEAEFSYEHKKFIEDWVDERHKENLKIGDLIDDELWAICERGIYHSFPKNKRIIMPIDYPIGDRAFEIYVQYRDNLGNNYSQSIYFMDKNSNQNPFEDAISKPNIPTVTKRIDLTNKNLTEEMLPEIAKGLVNLKKASIFCSYLKDREKIGVENYWEMKNL
ncbi:hypothetical protein [Psychroflexus aestuariivivens]|uniref:hypothetical protein n=1 Tax=Psychroflexus aestuariivivens TaxID=1795040 RepID=UPI000FDA5C00|nr:hypothetical protein [Psychroflexus aestuariivivens]